MLKLLIGTSLKKTLIRSSVLIIVAIFLVPVGFCLSFSWVDMHSRIPERSVKFSKKIKEIEATTSDGILISGWKLISDDNKPIIVLCHGVGSNRLQMSDQAIMVNKLGHSAIIFDFRNHGISEGNSTSYGFHEKEDIKAIAKKINDDNPGQKIILWGVSMGAATALLAAGEIENVIGVIAESPFSNLRYTFKHHAMLYFSIPNFPLVHITMFYMGLFGGFDVDEVSPQNAAKKLSHLPALFIAGAQDVRITPKEVKQVADAHTGEHKYLLLKGEHAQIFWEANDIYKKQVASFLSKHR